MRPILLAALTLFVAISETAAFSVAPSSSARGTSRSLDTSGTTLKMGILDFLGVGESSGFDAPCVMGEESIMSPKEHGTSPVPVQENLRWNCDNKVADNICNFNR